MSPADIIVGPHAAKYIYLNSVVDLCASVILYYDYAITLHWEIEFLWPPYNKLGLFTSACILNRYLPIIGHIPLLASYMAQKTPDVCQALHVYHEIFGMALQFLAGVICLVRVYALYGRSRRILGFLVFVGAASILTGCWAMVGSRRAKVETINVITSIPECHQFMPPEGGKFAALAWTGVLVFDSVIFSLTLFKAVTMGRGIRLLDVIVRDGTIYYSALFIVNLANIMTLRFAPPMLKGISTNLTNVLSTTLVSRLVLNLRAQNSAKAGLPITIESERRFQAALPVPVGVGVGVGQGREQGRGGGRRMTGSSLGTRSLVSVSVSPFPSPLLSSDN
ncbi:hypothetical protein B0F90DRAFT_181676 [Multifurca ochricompacta]|uniref:DUF6533 domain-containing protein n=1 Tax=Multifurca ochricompacta TaxID=376703 RepID=A0AAD4M5F8_9AGAM|nr:hypothetical protein B0F90DRAFT_181676 [Multifurca ochricompacta]